jgi:hypothetical protein
MSNKGNCFGINVLPSMITKLRKIQKTLIPKTLKSKRLTFNNITLKIIVNTLDEVLNIKKG